MEKLIRTNLKEKILNDHPNSSFQVLSKDELKQFLKIKLVEEAEEFLKSEKHSDETEELSDIIEVIETFFKLNYLNEDQVYKLKEDKLKKRGGFSEGLSWKT